MLRLFYIHFYIRIYILLLKATGKSLFEILIYELAAACWTGAFVLPALAPTVANFWLRSDGNVHVPWRRRIRSIAVLEFVNSSTRPPAFVLCIFPLLLLLLLLLFGRVTQTWFRPPRFVPCSPKTKKQKRQTRSQKRNRTRTIRNNRNFVNV